MSEKNSCRDCGQISSDLYWVNPNGAKMNQPRCAACHELAVRRKIKDDDQDVNSAYSTLRKINGVMRRGSNINVIG